MIKYIAHLTSLGEIARLDFGKASNNPAEGLDSETNLTLVHITEELPVTRDQFIRTRYYSEGSWVVRSEVPNNAATWNGSAWVWNSEDFLNLVRNARNSKLFETDWAVLEDSPLTDAEKAEARTYRTSLRNFTSTTMPSSGLLDDITWPTIPSCLA